MDLSAVASFLQSRGFPDYRFRQIVKNYYSGRYQSFLDQSDLPINLRQELDDNFHFLSLHSVDIFQSPKSTKAILALVDHLKIESVIMDYGQWTTACLSTQVGCPLKCSFCATGQMGFRRNLTAEEIIDQVLFWKNVVQKNISPPLVKEGAGGRLDRLVFMGMGEPFLNWDNLLDSLKVINQDLKIGARKISISTAGIIPRIYDFADLNTDINLAVSLHSLNPRIRSQLMPVNLQYPLPDLIKAIHHYTSHTRRQLFLEYALIDGLNDTPQDLKLIIDLLRSNYLFYLNLIPLNPTGGPLLPSTKLKYFHQELTRQGLNFSLRHSLGTDIKAACGQLVTRQ